MSKWERCNGEMHNIEPNLVNRTAAEMIDCYQMQIYELMKQTHPKMVGYVAGCHEVKDENGEVVDVHTTFYMTRPEDVEEDK